MDLIKLSFLRKLVYSGASEKTVFGILEFSPVKRKKFLLEIMLQWRQMCTFVHTTLTILYLIIVISLKRAGEGYKWKTGDIIIKDNVFIGAHAQIKYGVTIGPNAIVAMGSVVVKDVPEGTIVGGNPARVIGSFEDYANKV